MITPTISRRVWYWPNAFDRSSHVDPLTVGDLSQPLDAGICYVWNDRMVNLTVADQKGVMHARENVRLLQDDETPTNAGESYCQWMPFQQGQAKALTGHPEPASTVATALNAAAAAADLASPQSKKNPLAVKTKPLRVVKTTPPAKVASKPVAKKAAKKAKR